MSVVALLALIGTELALGQLVFGGSLVAQLASYGSAAGAIGIAAQIVFATFPVVHWRR